MLRTENIVLNKDTLEEIRGTSVLIVGLARTGVAAAIFLSRLGCRITISEKRQMDQVPKAYSLPSVLPTYTVPSCAMAGEDLTGPFVS